MNLNDRTSRTVRTAIQGIIATVIVTVGSAVIEAGTVLGLTSADWLSALDKGLVAGATTIVAAIVALAQNTAEDTGHLRPVAGKTGDLDRPL